ncbi:MAG: hypothetical protein QXU20_01435 [Candidatus Woesearchaeota archaeon]
MVKEISNRTLAVLLVLALAISIFGTFLSLQKISRLGVTGFATTGITNLTIASTKSINVQVANIDFGSGYATAGTTCVMESNATGPETNCNGVGSAGIDWNERPLQNYGGNPYFVINNTGNVNTNVSVNATDDATEWIGNYANVGAWIAGHESTQSPDACGTINTEYQTLGKGTPVVICTGTGLNWVDGNDTVYAAVKVSIPSSVPPGTNKHTTVTFYTLP